MAAFGLFNLAFATLARAYDPPLARQLTALVTDASGSEGLTGGEVEDHLAGVGVDREHDSAAPQTVLPQRQQIVGDVVLLGDVVEHAGLERRLRRRRWHEGALGGVEAVELATGGEVAHQLQQLSHLARGQHGIDKARQRGRAADRQALGATDLAPHVRVVAHQLDEQLDALRTRLAQAFARHVRNHFDFADSARRYGELYQRALHGAVPEAAAVPGRYDRSLIEGPLQPAVWKLAWPTMLAVPETQVVT